MKRSRASRCILCVAIALGVRMTAGCSVLSGLDDFDLASSAASAGGGAGGSGASGASGGGGGSGPTTGTGAQTGSGGSGPENCLDGVDNEGDGSVDCADADCAAVVECVDIAPAGWTGNARAHRVPYQASPSPLCSDGSEPTVYFIGPAGPAECAACSCNYTGASCTAPGVSCYFGVTDCSGSADIVIPPAAAACVSNPPTPASGVGSCAVTASPQVSSAGTCATSGGEIMNPTTWVEELRVCPGPAQTGEGCGAGQACAPKAPQGFDDMVCISKAGTESCPAGWTDTEAQAYTGANDTRSCAGCACDTATVTCSGGSARTYDNDACPMFSGIDIAFCDDQTTLMDNDSFSIRALAGTVNPGACPASTPTGSVQTTGATKFCCRQAVP